MGNQVSAGSGKVAVLDGFEPRVPRAVQLEGAGFVVHGRVSIAAHGRDRVHAVVRGGRPYDVVIGVTDAGEVRAECDCVRFQEAPAVCRHIWAALVEIQNADLLRLPALSAAAP